MVKLSRGTARDESGGKTSGNGAHDSQPQQEQTKARKRSVDALRGENRDPSDRPKGTVDSSSEPRRVPENAQKEHAVRDKIRSGAKKPGAFAGPIFADVLIDVGTKAL